MREVLPGVFHWTKRHPKIGIDVSSYYLSEAGVLIDPLMPEEGPDAFPGTPRHVLLTNRHHYRDSGEFAEHFGCEIRCVEQGLHEFQGGEPVRSFHFGDELIAGIEAIEIGVICPDETALLVPAGEGLVALADGIVREKDGPLGFVPDEYMGEDPDAVKAGLRKAYRPLLERSFDHLLLAHGWPWIGGGRQALHEFVTGRSTDTG